MYVGLKYANSIRMLLALHILVDSEIIGHVCQKIISVEQIYFTILLILCKNNYSIYFLKRNLNNKICFIVEKIHFFAYQNITTLCILKESLTKF